MQEATTKVYPLDTLRRSDEAVQTIGHIPEGCSNLFVSLRCSSVMVATATTPSLRLAIRTNYLQRGLEIYWTWVPKPSVQPAYNYIEAGEAVSRKVMSREHTWCEGLRKRALEGPVLVIEIIFRSLHPSSFSGSHQLVPFRLAHQPRRLASYLLHDKRR